MSAGDKRRMGSASHLGAQRPAGGAATSRFATELRPLSVGRGFLCSQKSEEMSRPVAPG